MYHFHFDKWPDFGEPETPRSFVRLLEECENLGVFDQKRSGPSVVHCSAGVGRSGTFILVDSMIQLYKISAATAVGSPSSLPGVRELLGEFRKYRMALVQTPNQLR